MARGVWRVGVVWIALCAIAACASPTADVQESEQLSGFKQETADRLAEIQSELEGLNLMERRRKLIELAQAEGGTVTVYGVTNLDDMDQQIDEFEEATDLTVNYFRAGSDDVLQRLVEESKADFRGADAINENGAEMAILDREGLLAPIDTPVSERITPEGVHDTWLWGFIDIFTAAWNTDLLPQGNAPRTWEEVLTDFDGQVLIDAGDEEWLASLVKDYFMAERGMSEAEALDFFREAMKGATFIDSHLLQAEFVSAGEYQVAATAYRHTIIGLMADAAPITWEPAVEPLVARPEGVGVHAAAEHPASALLFVEWYVTNGQLIGQSQDRQPASTAVKGGGLPTEYESIVVDPESVTEEFDKWSGIYEELINLSGKDVIEDE